MEDVINHVSIESWKISVSFQLQWTRTKSAVAVKTLSAHDLNNLIKGQVRSKNKLSLNEKAWKMQKKPSHYWYQCAK